MPPGNNFLASSLYIFFVYKIIMVNNGIKYLHLIKSIVQLYIVDSIIINRKVESYEKRRQNKF